MKRTGVAMLMFAFALWAPYTAVAESADDDPAVSSTRSVAAAATPDAALAAAAEQNEDDVLPASDAHRIQAPEIDIAGLRDPFESYLTVLERQNQQRMQASRNKAPDHKAQPLENFDLGALRLVAIMKMGETRAAMVQDPEGKGYVVRAGTYIGRDNGRVTKISERSVDIMEDEFTAAGDIVKRKASLTLNEVNQ